MRLIDADELIKKFLNVCRTEFEVKNKCMTDENILHLIYEAPTVEITEEQAIDKLHETGWLPRHDKEMTERPQGEWVMNKISARGRNYTCTNCQKVSRSKSEFCQKCGAKMRVKQ